MPNRDPIFFNHGSNPRVPSPAAKALAFALKTKEATRDVKKRTRQLVLHKSEHLRPYFIPRPEGQRRISRACNLDYNLVAGPRFEVNARGIIPRDDKLQTSYVEPSDQRAEFYALKRCPRDARGARARSVWNIRPDGCPSVVIGTTLSKLLPSYPKYHAWKTTWKKKRISESFAFNRSFWKNGLLEGIRLIDDLLFTLTYNIV